MQAFSPKAQNAIQRSTGRPVIYAEISTRIQDFLIETYNDWTTVGAPDNNPNALGYILGQYRTAIVKEHEQTSNPPAILQMLYPAQGGDPVQSAIAVNMSLASPADGDAPLPLFFTNGLLGFQGQIFQTFTLTLSDRHDYDIQSIALKLKIITDLPSVSIPVFLKVFDRTTYGSLPAQLAFYAPNTASDTVTINGPLNNFTEVDFPFTANPLKLVRGRNYMVLVGLVGRFFVTSSSTTLSLLTYRGRNQFPGEWGGYITINPDLQRSDLIQLYLKVKSKVYSFDGATTNYRDVKLDLGSAPANAGFFDLNYRTPGDSRLRFRAWASDTGAFAGEETDIGKTDNHTLAVNKHDGSVTHVHDGDAITVLKRYYKIKCELSSPSLLYTPSVHKLNVLFPVNKHKFCSSALPILEAIPAIQDIPAIPTKLDMKSYVTQVQDWRLDLIDIGGHASVMAMEDNLKNSPVDLFIGMLDQPIISRADLAPYASGKVIDYEFEEGLLSLIIQDQSKDLSLKIPNNYSNLRAAPPPLDYGLNNGRLLVDVLDDLLFNQVRIQRRYKDEASFTEVRDTYLGVQWITGRIITEPTEARQLITEILTIIGCFLVPGEDGKLRLIRYPRSGSSVATWDTTDLLIEPKQPKAIADSIINQCLVRYNPSGQGSDYLGWELYIDGPSQADWAPGSKLFVADRTVETPWIGSEVYKGPYLAAAVAQRIVKTAKDGIVQINCATTLKHMAVQVGDLISLKTPVYLRKGFRGTLKAAQQFMVISKTPRYRDGTIDWSLVEAKDFNRPPIPSFTATPSAGLPPFTVAVDATATTDPDGDAITAYEWDFDYDGATFTVDATGVTQSHQYTSASIGRKIIALRAKDSNGATAIATREIRVRALPTAVIALNTVTDPGQPLLAIFDGSSSFSPSGQIVKYEWDLNYGVSGAFGAAVFGEAGFGEEPTFTVDAVGVQASLSLPYKTTTVALRITDEDGGQNIATFLITGKTLAPGAVTGFYVAQVGDKLAFNWDPNPDLDLKGYEIRAKYEATGAQTATWADSDLVSKQELTNSFVTVISKPFGFYTFLIKAFDSTGNYNAAATAIFIKTLDPQDRNVLVSRDEKALGWTGTKSQLIQDIGGNSWWIAPLSDTTLGALPDTPMSGLPDTPLALLTPAYPSGTYETAVIDLGAVVAPVRISAQAVTNSIPDGSNTQVVIEFKTSDNGVDYTAYSPIRAADLSFRYARFRVTLKQFDNASNVALQNLLVTFDVPDLLDSNEDVDVQVGGTAVVFAVAFNIVPSISYAIQNVTAAHFLEITGKSKTGFTMKLRRSSDGADVGSGGTRLVDWQAIAY